ncbi:MAG: 50S ribosomal protein L24 [Chloroflexi bacterium]|jgi:large subunit ribosomal protein L24|nr:50S ribosomal protein L24 [Chloroflexota bacterium]HEV8053913.1 50S ribosomal protein L24 [Candidatus Limnocylindrales bacterium]
MARATPEPRATRVVDIRRGDEVLILTGKDAGKRGTVERMANPDRVVVEGLNLAKRHTKPRPRQGRTERQPRIQQGGILEIARPLHLSNVMLVCPSCHRPTRVRHDQAADGRSVRVCRHCGEALTRIEKGKS